MGAAKNPIAMFRAIHCPFPLVNGLQTLIACIQSAYFVSPTDEAFNLQSWQWSR